MKKSLCFGLIFLILLFPVASAFSFSDFFAKITGKPIDSGRIDMKAETNQLYISKIKDFFGPKKVVQVYDGTRFKVVKVATEKQMKFFDKKKLSEVIIGDMIIKTFVKQKQLVDDTGLGILDMDDLMGPSAGEETRLEGIDEMLAEAQGALEKAKGGMTTDYVMIAVAAVVAFGVALSTQLVCCADDADAWCCGLFSSPDSEDIKEELKGYTQGLSYAIDSKGKVYVKDTGSKYFVPVNEKEALNNFKN